VPDDVGDVKARILASAAHRVNVRAAMRNPLAIVSVASVVGLVLFAATGCGKAENEGAAEAKKEADDELAKKVANHEVAAKISPPVPGRAKIPCEELIDANAFQQALGEKDPVSVKDVTNTATEATASCSLIRGGKVLSAGEQASLLKTKGRLGVMPGDEMCNVTAFCWTIEDPDRFKRRCAEMKNKDDESMGTYACVQVVATGEDDVNNYKFYDADTKCVLQVRGGPSMVDNNFIATCAKAARDLIGPNQIAVNPAGAAAPAPAPAGSAKP
jgi:hypothetical protein